MSHVRPGAGTGPTDSRQRIDGAWLSPLSDLLLGAISQVRCRRSRRTLSRLSQLFWAVVKGARGRLEFRVQYDYGSTHQALSISLPGPLQLSEWTTTPLQHEASALRFRTSTDLYHHVASHLGPSRHVHHHVFSSVQRPRMGRPARLPAESEEQAVEHPRSPRLSQHILRQGATDPPAQLIAGMGQILTVDSRRAERTARLRHERHRPLATWTRSS